MQVEPMGPSPVELTSRCSRIPTSAWSDALDACGLAGSVIRGLSRRSGHLRVAGPAVTVEETVQNFGDAPLSAFALEAVFAATEPGSVLVFCAAGANVSTLGGLAAKYATMKGVQGVIIDGACRDVEEIETIGLSVWSTHVTPTSGKQRIRIEAVNRKCLCSSVTVTPGDWVIADRTGIVVVPQPKLKEVLGLAEALIVRDSQFEAALVEGVQFGQAVAKVGHI